MKFSRQIQDPLFEASEPSSLFDLQIESLRVRSTRLLSSLLVPAKKREFLVLGSAPQTTISPQLLGERKLICVNGSGWSARKHQLPEPELTVISAALLRTILRYQGTQKALRGLHTKKLLLITFGNDRESSEQMLRELGYSYNSLQTMSFLERAYLIEAVTGVRRFGYKRADRISNGLVAACYAIASGAAELILSGISAEHEGGHPYQSTEKTNPHHENDRAAIEILAKKYKFIKTTEASLSTTTGLPLHSNRAERNISPTTGCNIPAQTRGRSA